MATPDGPVGPESAVLDRILHELRGPLTVVSGYLRLLVDQSSSLDAGGRTALGHIERASATLAERLGELKQLVALSEPGVAVSAMTLDLGALVTAAAASVVEGADRGVRIEVLPVSTSGRQATPGDASLLGPAVVALATAVCRASADGMTVVVTVGETPPGTRPHHVVTIGSRAAAPGLVPDAPPATVADLLASLNGGHGLGLLVADRVVALHAGRLWVEGGPTVRVALPASAARAAAPSR